LAGKYHVDESRDLEEAGNRLAVRRYQCVVLDEQSSRMNTASAIGLLSQVEPIETFPLIVLSKKAEDGMHHVLAGAHDSVYEPEGTECGELCLAIEKAIARSAILRKRLSSDHVDTTKLENQAATAEGMFYWTSSSVTASNYGMVTLQTSLPDVFDELVRTFDALVERCLEERLYRVSQPVSSELSDLALRLGSLRAGPRDVVEVYGTCLKRKVRDRSRLKGAAYADAGQLLALELMGYLVSYYRNLARRAVASISSEASPT
jgi:hypothetical protein